MSDNHQPGSVWQRLARLLGFGAPASAEPSVKPSSPSSASSTSSGKSGPNDYFEQAVRFVIRWETVYRNGTPVATNDPDDPGGLTKFGIDQRSNPGVDIANLDEQRAVELYRREWADCRADSLEWPLALAHFDAAVNVGPGQAARFLQRAVGADADGVIGPKTLQAVQAACDDRGAKSVALAVCLQRNQFYRALVERKPVFGKFLRGWLRRVEDLNREINLA
jgi:lysozyme family protein